MGGGGGGGAAQEPYVPGENDRLAWMKASNLQKILNREEGNTRPLLVFLYSSGHADDTTAVNFERTLFRYDKIVKLAKGFDCVKYQCTGNSPMYKKFMLNKKKPAILLLDAEGGMIHKQQTSADPKKYLRVLKSSFALNSKRIDLRDKYAAKREEIREQIQAKKFAKALRTIEKTLKKKDFLMGDLQVMLEQDRSEIADIGEEMFDRANQLRENKEYKEALDLFRTIKKEFAKLDVLGKKANRSAKDVQKAMRENGISSR